MKKVSDILLTVTTVLTWITFGVMLLLGVLFLVFSLPPVWEIWANNAMDANGNPATPEMLMAIRLTFIVSAVAFLLVAGGAIPLAIFTSRAKRTHSKVDYILCIVFGVLADVPVAIVASVLGLIGYRDENVVSNQ